MCGRVRLSSDVSDIRIAFRIPPERPIPNFPPSRNAAPTDSLPVVRFDAKAGQRSLDVLRWGLIPYWAKDMKVGFANINAKAEGIENKPAFRKALERRRCLVPVDNFYEWKKTGTGKQPYAIALADRGIMALAGGGVDPLLRDRHHPAERIVRRASHSHACRVQNGRVAGMARRRTGDPARSQGDAGPLPFRRHDLLAGEHAGRQRQEQRSHAHRADQRSVIR